MAVKVAQEPRVAVFDEQGGRVARLVLSASPDNALDLTMIDSLRQAVDLLARESRLGAVILQGEGRDFSIGHPRTQLRAPFAAPMLEQFHDAARALLNLNALLISIVRGRCFGAGSALAFLADFVLADNTARFQLVDDTSALPPLLTAVATHRLDRSRAASALLTEKVLNGEQAAALGLVTDYYDGGWDTATIAESHLRQYALTTPAVVMNDVVPSIRAPLLAHLTRVLPALEQKAVDRMGRRVDEEVTAPTKWRPG